MSTQTSTFSDSYWSWDVFLMGGLSIVVCLLAWALMDKGTSVMTMSHLAYGLAFLINHPHFLSSYCLLYGDFRGSIMKQPKYFWAAVIAPAILAGVLIWAIVQRDRLMMGHMVNAMFFLVGWHYVKQVFGCVIVTSAQRKLYYKPWERRLFLVNLFGVWFMSWLNSQVGASNFDFYGISYSSLNLPAWTLKATYGVVGASFFANIWMHVRKYIEEGRMPSPPGVAAFLALYAWYLPTFSHPGFAYLIPLFHSLQYMAFVWRFKGAQVEHHLSDLEGRDQREGWVKYFGGFMITAFILGALSFEFVPKALDARVPDLIASGILGHSPFLAAFLLFINVHHYFIDNVIWRSDNPAVKQFLFSSKTTGAPASAKRAA